MNKQENFQREKLEGVKLAKITTQMICSEKVRFEFGSLTSKGLFK